MPIVKRTARQQIISAYVDLTFADVVNGVAQAAIEIPAGAVVTEGDVVTSVVFNSVTSDVVAVGDALVANRYLAAGNVAALGRVALVPTGYQNPAKTNISLTWTGVGAAPTTGSIRLRVDYYVANRSQFAQGVVTGNRTDGTLA